MVSSIMGIEHRRPSMQSLTTCKQKKHSLLNLGSCREYQRLRGDLWVEAMKFNDERFDIQNRLE